MNSYINIFIFIVITVVYYIALKPKITFDILSSDVSVIQYFKTNLIYLAVYVLLAILTQFVLNAFIISNNCGGSIPQNLGVAGLMTLLPWIFIFGGMVAILIVFPGFKSAFSDVVGYYFVSSSASKILNELLIDAEVYNEIETSSEGNKEKLEALKATASLVTKLTGNMSLLINKIVPKNFIQFWDLLKPLMKEQYKNGDNATSLRDSLLNLAFVRDNIGEGMWYLYTGIMLVSIIQFNLATRGCVSNLATMQKNYAKFQEKEEETLATSANTPTTVYTITN
jgi:acyl-CoA synthetase (AMP-forming)/AMP-acid ligase II